MRVTNWRDELHAVFAAAQGRRFRWGRHDCCQFAAKCVRAVSGYESRLQFPKYRTRAEAEQILAKVGGIRELITIALGSPVPVARAGVGDIVLMHGHLGLQPMVCMGLESFGPGMRNLQPWPTAMALAARII